MGQKVNPNGFRIGVNKDWNSTWVANKKDIATYLKEDHSIREHIMNNYGGGQNNCMISKIAIERTPARISINVSTGRPGMLIGQKGAGIDKLKNELQKYVDKKTIELNVREVKNQDTDATLVAQSIASQLERRIAWRRAMKMAIQKAMKSGVKGIKVMVGGRLDGADIARSEHYQQGILPLHTLRSDIDYGFAEAKTTFGIIGIKCWICYGEIKGKTRRSGEITRGNRPERAERPRDERRPFNPDRKTPRPFNPSFRPNNGAPRPEGQAPHAPRGLDSKGNPHTHTAHASGAPRAPRPDAVKDGSVTRVHQPTGTGAQSFGGRAPSAQHTAPHSAKPTQGGKA
jgi:small subunit ribosomal protein S3